MQAHCPFKVQAMCLMKLFKFLYTQSNCCILFKWCSLHADNGNRSKSGGLETMVLPHCCLSPRRSLWCLIWKLLATNTSYTFSDVITSYVYTTVIIYFPSCDKLCDHFHDTIRISNMIKSKSDVYIISYHCICTKHEITNVRSSQTYWPYKTSEPNVLLQHTFFCQCRIIFGNNATG